MFPDWLIWIVLFLVASLAFLFILSLPHIVEDQQSFDIKSERYTLVQILGMDICYFVFLVFNVIKAGFVNLIKIFYHPIIDMNIRQTINDDQTNEHPQTFTENRSLIKQLSKKSRVQINCTTDSKTILSKTAQNHIKVSQNIIKENANHKSNNSFQQERVDDAIERDSAVLLHTKQDNHKNLAVHKRDSSVILDSNPPPGFEHVSNIHRSQIAELKYPIPQSNLEDQVVPSSKSNTSRYDSIIMQESNIKSRKQWSPFSSKFHLDIPNSPLISRSLSPVSSYTSTDEDHPIPKKNQFIKRNPNLYQPLDINTNSKTKNASITSFNILAHFHRTENN